MRKITEIIIHCSDSPFDRDVSVSDIDAWHKKRGFKCIGYHYVIYLDGSVHGGRPLDLVGAHCSGHNRNSVGICYVGGSRFGKHCNTLNVRQLESLKVILKNLMFCYNVPYNRVYLHNELTKNKVCPCFDRKWFDLVFKSDLDII